MAAEGCSAEGCSAAGCSAAGCAPPDGSTFQARSDSAAAIRLRLKKEGCCGAAGWPEASPGPLATVTPPERGWGQQCQSPPDVAVANSFPPPTRR
jgi:hypothetical protein